MWLVGVVSRRRVWLVGVGGIYGCGCKEVYRFPVADLGGFQRFPLKPPLANSIIEIH